VVPSDICRVLRVGFVKYCISSLYYVGWVLRPGLMGDAENVRFGDLHPHVIVSGIFDVIHLFFFVGCDRCL